MHVSIVPAYVLQHTILSNHFLVSQNISIGTVFVPSIETKIQTILLFCFLFFVTICSIPHVFLNFIVFSFFPLFLPFCPLSPFSFYNDRFPSQVCFLFLFVVSLCVLSHIPRPIAHGSSFVCSDLPGTMPTSTFFVIPPPVTIYRGNVRIRQLYTGSESIFK